MLIYLKANMELFDSPLKAAIHTSHQKLMKESRRMDIAMNWFRMNRAKDQPVIIWHNGATSGYRSFLGFTEDGGFGVVILANTSKSMDKLGRDLLSEMEKTLTK